ncbi:alpha-amylase [Limosilactobacillus vaginalis]|uniref:alpha-amylase n=1 Tax=Limosilactobacillus vaginalis TaxID=1633 RepID=UPI0037363A78
MSDGPKLDLWNEPSPFQNSQAYEQKNHNWDVLRNYGDYIGSYLKGITDSWDVRFSAQLNQIAQPNEVIDARVDVNGHTFPDLHDHLINIEETKLGFVEANDFDDATTDDETPGTILKITDLTTSSYNMRYVATGTVGFTLPRVGYMETTTNNLTINPD